MSEKPGFFQRLSLALRVLGDPALAARVDAELLTADEADRAPPPQLTEPTTERKVERVVEKSKITIANPESGALHMLAILQRDGRLIDFLHEDVGAFSDSDVGAAARVVHVGCKKALGQYFTFEPVKKEAEGAAVVVEKGFDPAQIRLAGNVTGEPPFRGKLAHAGWRATDVRLPDRPPAVDARVVAPAEVEI